MPGCGSVVDFGFALRGMPVAEAVSRTARSFLEREAEIFPTLFDVVADVASATRESRAALRAGLRCEEQRNTGARCCSSSDAPGEECKLLPIPLLLERAAAWRGGGATAWRGGLPATGGAVLASTAGSASR